MGSPNEIRIQTKDLIQGVAICSEGAEVMESIVGSEPHSFQGNLWEAHHLQQETVQMDRVNIVHGIQTR